MTDKEKNSIYDEKLKGRQLRGDVFLTILSKRDFFREAQHFIRVKQKMNKGTVKVIGNFKRKDLIKRKR